MMGYMGKWLLKSLIMMALMMGVSSYLLYVRTGHTPWSLMGIHSWDDAVARAKPDVNIQQMERQVKQKLEQLSNSASDALPDALPELSAGETQQVYRWVDTKGVTHFGEAPPEGVQAEQIILQPNRNLIQAPAETEAARKKTQVDDVQSIVDGISQRRQETLDKAEGQ